LIIKSFTSEGRLKTMRVPASGTGHGREINRRSE